MCDFLGKCNNCEDPHVCSQLDGENPCFTPFTYFCDAKMREPSTGECGIDYVPCKETGCGYGYWIENKEPYEENTFAKDY